MQGSDTYNAPRARARSTLPFFEMDAMRRSLAIDHRFPCVFEICGEFGRPLYHASTIQNTH